MKALKVNQKNHSKTNKLTLRVSHREPKHISNGYEIYQSKQIRQNTQTYTNKLDKGKSILEAPPKLEKKNTKYTKAKKATSQKPKQKKQHLCHHCGIASHTRPNCYKWLAT